MVVYPSLSLTLPLTLSLYLGDHYAPLFGLNFGFLPRASRGLLAIAAPCCTLRLAVTLFVGLLSLSLSLGCKSSQHPRSSLRRSAL